MLYLWNCNGKQFYLSSSSFWFPFENFLFHIDAKTFSPAETNGPERDNWDCEICFLSFHSVPDEARRHDHHVWKSFSAYHHHHHRRIRRRSLPQSGRRQQIDMRFMPGGDLWECKQLHPRSWRRKSTWALFLSRSVGNICKWCKLQIGFYVLSVYRSFDLRTGNSNRGCEILLSARDRSTYCTLQ